MNDAQPQPETSPTKKTLLQRLRTVLLVMLLCFVCLFTYGFQRSQERQELRQELKKSGITILPRGGHLAAWLNHYFPPGLSLLPDSGAVLVTSDEGMKSLTRLYDKRIELLHCSNITDEGFKSLAVRKDVKEIAMNNSPITNAGLKSVGNLPNLQALHLSVTSVTNDGLKSFVENNKNLRQLTVDGQPPSQEIVKLLQKRLPKQNSN